MINITDNAQKHFLNLLNKKKLNTNIRLIIINPGKINAECNILYCQPNEIQKSDIKIQFKKILIIVDKISYMYLKNSNIDFIEENLNSNLILTIPKIQTNKFKENNYSIEEHIEYILQSQINPKLFNHRGFVTLIKVTDNMLAILKLHGGCNGCAMANYTIKEWIEKELMKKIPKLKGVIDSTNHKRNKKSFY